MGGYFEVGRDGVYTTRETGRRIEVEEYAVRVCEGFGDEGTPCVRPITCCSREPENLTKTLKPGFAKCAVDANLFLLGSTNPEKKFPAPGCFFFYWKCFSRIDLDLLFESTRQGMGGEISHDVVS